jgi:hypothetical protein
LDRSQFKASPGKKICETPTSTEKNWTWGKPLSSQCKRGGSGSDQPGQKVRPNLQTDQINKGWRCVEHLPSKCKDLSSNSRTTKKPKPKNQNQKNTHTKTKQALLSKCMALGLLLNSVLLSFVLCNWEW